jgi:hypothetical protein
MGNFGMGLHPGRCGPCLTVWQQVHDLVGVQVHQNRAEDSASQKQEIVDT